jgi:serine/threonine-protein kinase
MGVVVAATQVELDRLVALKFLLPHVIQGNALSTRFAREARAVAKLESDHVARVLDVGALDSGDPFIVMEYLDGVDLAQLLKAQGPLPCDLAIRHVLEACEALAEAHAHGIIHRDLKPGNLFLAKRVTGPPIIKVLDFGLSKLAGDGDQHITSTSSLLGSPLYMSPEQLLSARDVDARTDLWSLGVVLFELLTGETPFRGEQVMGVMAAILHKPARSLDSLRPELPAEVKAAVHRCLEKEPDQRFSSVVQLAKVLAPYGPASSLRSLEHILHTLPVPAVEPGVVDASAALAATVPAGSSRPSVAAVQESVTGSIRSIRKSEPPSRLRGWLVTAGALGAIGVGAWATVHATAARMVTAASSSHVDLDPRPSTTPPPASAAILASASASASEPAPAAASESAPAPAVSRVHPHPVAPEKSAVASAAPAPTAPVCSYQSYVDPADGEVHFRKVCR